MEGRRAAFCAEVSSENAEPLAATASHIDHWLLVEYRGLWSSEPLEGSRLSDPVEAHLREQLATLPRSRLLFVRRPQRRAHPGLAVFLAGSVERAPWLRGLELEDHEELLSLDLAAMMRDGAGPARALDHPLLVVCTHGKRDRCCARYGRPLYEALRDEAGEGWVWQSTHVGGDRFAGNLVCLPEGLYFGRVAREEVTQLLDEYLAGRIYLERYRGRSCYPFVVQAAERAVRERAGLTGIDDLGLESAERTPGGRWRVRFRAGGDLHEVDLAAELGDLTHLTCSALTLKRPRRFVATAHRVATAR